MQVFDRKWTKKLEDQGVDVKLYKRYMDDGRTILHPFHHGWKWLQGEGLMFNKKWVLEDNQMSLVEVTKNILLESMRGVEPYLKFTVETGEDPGYNGWLPTLDTNIMVTKDNMIRYKYYEKPTTTEVTMQKNTAMAENPKVQILVNDLVRRFKNTSLELRGEQHIEIVDGYTQKLANSGYSSTQIRRIIISGIRGYNNKVARCKEQGTRLHRTAQECSNSRTRRKLLGKSNWFRGSSKASSTTNTSVGVSEKSKKAFKKQNKTLKTRSVLFIEQTPKGELAKQIRELLQRLEPSMGFKIRVVERSGKSLAS